MAGKNGKEVGRVSLRVLPNMDHFKRDAEKKLRKYKKIKVPVEPEIEDFKHKVKEAAKQAKTNVEIGTDFDSGGLSTKASLAAKAASRFKVWYRADLDTKAAMLKTAAFSKVLQEVFSQKNYKFDAGVLSLRRALQEAGVLDGILKGSIKTLKMWGAEWVRIKNLIPTALDTPLHLRHLGVLRSMMSATKLLGKSFLRMGAEIGRSIKVFPSMMNAVRGFASLANVFAAGMAVISGSAVLFNGLMVGLSAVIGYITDAVKQLSRVALLIPGILGGAGMIGATLFTGFRGLGKALSTAVDLTADLEPELENLAPSAADFARSLRKITPAWSEVRKSVQGKMFEGMGKELERVSTQQLPTLRRGMESIATSTNRFFKEFGEFATHERTTEALNKGFASTDRVLKNMARSLKPVLLGLQDIGVIGLDVLAKASEKWPKTFERFSNWTGSEEGQSKIREWIDDSLQGFKDLGATVGNLYETFKQVGNAFGINFDSSALEVFREKTEDFREWIGLAEDADSRISKFTKSVKELSGPWIDSFKSMWSDMKPALDEIMPLMKDISTQMAEDLANAVEWLAPRLKSLFKLLSDFGGPISKLVAGFMTIRLGLGVFKLFRALVTPLLSLLLGLGKAAFNIGKFLVSPRKALDDLGNSAKEKLGIVEKESKKAGDSVVASSKKMDKAAQESATILADTTKEKKKQVWELRDAEIKAQKQTDKAAKKAQKDLDRQAKRRAKFDADWVEYGERQKLKALKEGAKQEKKLAKQRLSDRRKEQTAALKDANTANQQTLAQANRAAANVDKAVAKANRSIIRTQQIASNPNLFQRATQSVQSFGQRVTGATPAITDFGNKTAEALDKPAKKAGPLSRGLGLIGRGFGGFAGAIAMSLGLSAAMETISPSAANASEGTSGLQKGVEDLDARLAEKAPNLESNTQRIVAALKELFSFELGETWMDTKIFGQELVTDQDLAMLDKASTAFANFVDSFANDIKPRLESSFQDFKSKWGAFFSGDWDYSNFHDGKLPFEDLSLKVTTEGNKLLDKLGDVKEKIVAKLREKMEGLDTQEQSFGGLGQKLDNASNDVDSKGNTLVQKLTGIKDRIKEALSSGEGEENKFHLPDPDVEGFQEKVSTTLTTVTTAITTWASNIGTTFMTGLSDVGTGIATWFSDTVTNVSTLLSTLPSIIGSIFSTLGSTIGNMFGSAVSGVVGRAQGIITGISGVLSALPSVVGSFFSTAGSVMISTIQNAASSMIGALSGMIGQAVGVLSQLPGQAQAALGNVGGILVASGQALVQGFINGISSMVGAVASAAQSVVSAARAFFPFSPAKKGPFSGKGYTTHSGKALVKDFARGMLSEESNLNASTAKLLKSSQKHFGAVNSQSMENYQRKKILDPVLESNAEKIARWREREAENLKKSNEKIDKINSKDDKSTDKAKKIAEEKADLAKRNKESYKELLESLEAPDYSDIDRSFNAYWIDGLKSQMNEAVTGVAKDMDLVNKSRAEGLRILSRAKKEFGNVQLYPGFDLNRMSNWLKSKEFGDTVYRALEEANIGAIPIEFAVSNIDQLRSDLNMGDGVLSRAIDAGMAYNYAASDMKYERDNKVEVHYHVADMQEAIRLEKQRERKQMMKMKR